MSLKHTRLQIIVIKYGTKSLIEFAYELKPLGPHSQHFFLRNLRMVQISWSVYQIIFSSTF
jgi:hypothetical protein